MNSPTSRCLPRRNCLERSSAMQRQLWLMRMTTKKKHSQHIAAETAISIASWAQLPARRSNRSRLLSSPYCSRRKMSSRMKTMSSFHQALLSSQLLASPPLNCPVCASTSAAREQRLVCKSANQAGIEIRFALSMDMTSGTKLRTTGSALGCRHSAQNAKLH